MTSNEAIQIVKDAMTALLDTTPKEFDEQVNDFVFTDHTAIERILTANSMACEAINLADKYKWHAPTIEAEPIRHGHWVNYQGHPIIVDNQGYVRGEQAFCSACGEYLNGSDEYSVKGRYCPSCGAKMEGK